MDSTSARDSTLVHRTAIADWPDDRGPDNPRRLLCADSGLDVGALGVPDQALRLDPCHVGAHTLALALTLDLRDVRAHT